jgi:hypothetical protein
VTIDDKAEQLKQLVRTGKAKGYVLYDEIDELLPTGYGGGPELDDILSELARNGIEALEVAGAEGDKELNDVNESLDENDPAPTDVFARGAGHATFDTRKGNRPRQTQQRRRTGRGRRREATHRREPVVSGNIRKALPEPWPWAARSASGRQYRPHLGG